MTLKTKDCKIAFYQRKPDIIIRGGTIVDGIGKLPYYGDKIDYIGDLKGVSAPLEIDARGKYVTPGFIDCHTHSDKTIFSLPGCENLLYQGITTQVVGNCGMLGLNVPIPEDERLPAGTVAAVLDQKEWTTLSSTASQSSKRAFITETAPATPCVILLENKKPAYGDFRHRRVLGLHKEISEQKWLKYLLIFFV